VAVVGSGVVGCGVVGCGVDVDDVGRCCSVAGRFDGCVDA